jgi:hypothetical protein
MEIKITKFKEWDFVDMRSDVKERKEMTKCH